MDEWNNVACAVAGRRRFTLFPPEQIANLYIGPLDFAPTGAAMSMVNLRNPDFARYPRFKDALAAAQVAELEPGDAVFIPPLWWHHVESLEPFNVLVNYWWHDPLGASTEADSAFDALLHGILSIRGLPSESRRAWSAFFEQYVFGDANQSIEHIPPHRHGILRRIVGGAAKRAARALGEEADSLTLFARMGIGPPNGADSPSTGSVRPRGCLRLVSAISLLA